MTGQNMRCTTGAGQHKQVQYIQRYMARLGIQQAEAPLSKQNEWGSSLKR
jgi:hypothetical protein